MKRLLIAMMAVIFLGISGMILADESVDPVGTPVVSATPAPVKAVKKEKKKKAKKVKKEGTVVTPSTPATPTAK